MADFVRYRRHLPHWRLQGAVYFVTWRLHRGQTDLVPPERELVLEAIVHYNDARYTLYAAVVMNDHAHLLVQPLPAHPLERILHSRKSWTAHRLVSRHGRVAPVWQAEYFDRVVRDEAEFLEKYRYILENPARRWPGTEDYAWLWTREAAVSPGP